VSEAGVYVYGAVRADELAGLDLAGVAGEDGGPVATIERGGVAALVSQLDDETLEAASALRTHWKVLEEVSAAATVAPVRFGTVLADESAVVEDFLEPEGERLAALLAGLAGKVQLSVRAFYDEDRLLAGIVEGSPEIAQLRERVKGQPGAAAYYDQIRLGELVSAEVEAARAGDTQLVLERLGPLAVDVITEAPATEEMAVNAAFLVESDRVEEFSNAVGGLAEEVGDRLRIRFVGPMPAYSFADAGAPTGS
jgi:hypothetical protein